MSLGDGILDNGDEELEVEVRSTHMQRFPAGGLNERDEVEEWRRWRAAVAGMKKKKSVAGLVLVKVFPAVACKPSLSWNS